MTLSERGLEFVANWEGFRSRAYDDGVGVITIGYGHALHRLPWRPSDRLLYWTRRYALRRLDNDAARYESYVRQYVKVPLNQHQFDALTSFCFNLGPGGLSQLVRDSGLNKGAYNTVAEHMLHYNHGGGHVIAGLTRRRKAEAAMFLHGTYHT